jgi:hypothetical protein
MTKPVKQTERILHKKVRSWLVGQGLEVIKLTTMKRYGSAGWPDLLILDKAPRLPLFLELKAEDGQVTPLQADKIKKLRERGYPVFVARSVHEAQVYVEAWLEFRTGVEDVR